MASSMGAERCFASAALAVRPIGESIWDAVSISPEHEQVDLATPAANCAAQWPSRALETVVRPIRLWVGRWLARQSEQRDTFLELQIEIGTLACRIVRIVVGLCEGRVIGVSRYCRPLRCRTCIAAAGSSTSDILTYGGTDTASGGAEHEGHGSISASVDHRAIAGHMVRANSYSAVCDADMKSLTCIGASPRQIRIEFQKQTVDLLVGLSLCAADVGEDTDRNGRAAQEAEHGLSTAAVRTEAPLVGGYLLLRYAPFTLLVTCPARWLHMPAETRRRRGAARKRSVLRG